MRSCQNLFTRFIAPLFCLTLMVFLAACGNGGNTASSTKAPSSQQVFRDPIVASDINTFDPPEATDEDSITAIDAVFTGLVQENDKLQVQAQLAQSYSSSADGLTWTFKLRPNLKFSDGTPLTSADVAYSIDRALSPAIYNTTGVSLTYLGLIQGASDRVKGKVSTIIGTGIQTPDANTVVIHVTKSTAYFLQALTYPTSYVVEKKVIDQWGTKWTDHLGDNGGQGGDGPFKVQSYNHSTGITLIPNPNYYGPIPQLQKFQLPFIKDTNTSYSEYQANQVDFTGIPTADYAAAQAKTAEFRKVPQLWIDYFGLNYLVKPFDNIDIRQAMDLALNKNVLNTSIFGGRFIPSNHIIPQGMPGYDSSLTGPDGVTSTAGDPAKAKALFQQGLQQEHMTLAQFPTIQFTYASGSPDENNLITTVIQMWQQVLGITTIKPSAVDPTQLFSLTPKTAGNTSLQMWSIAWIADYPDPQDWITLQFAKGSAENEINYGQNNGSNAAAQQALQNQMVQSDTITNQTQRFQTINQIEQQLVNDVAWLPTDQETETVLVKSYIHNLALNSQGLIPPNDWGNIYVSTH